MRLLGITPMLAVADISAAESFLAECLGFETTFRQDNYAFCRRAGGAIRLILAEPDADMDDPARQHIVYLDTDDVDGYFEAHREALEKLPEGHFRPPFDQPYMQREMHIIHGPFLFMVGQDIRDRT